MVLRARPPQSPRTVSEQWSCNLLASPDQVRKNDQVTLTVTLSAPDFPGELSEEAKKKVYTDGFIFHFSSTSNTKLGNAVEAAYTGPGTSKTSEAIQFNFAVPADIQGGDYDIDVTGNPISGFDPPEGLTTPSSVTNTATISVITNLIETESKVTLQRTFAGKTDDRALWPAIRNRTAAIGFERYKRFIDCILLGRGPQRSVKSARRYSAYRPSKRCIR